MRERFFFRKLQLPVYQYVSKGNHWDQAPNLLGLDQKALCVDQQLLVHLCPIGAFEGSLGLYALYSFDWTLFFALVPFLGKFGAHWRI